LLLIVFLYIIYPKSTKSFNTIVASKKSEYITLLSLVKNLNI